MRGAWGAEPRGQTLSDIRTSTALAAGRPRLWQRVLGGGDVTLIGKDVIVVVQG